MNKRNFIRWTERIHLHKIQTFLNHVMYEDFICVMKCSSPNGSCRKSCALAEESARTVATQFLLRRTLLIINRIEQFVIASCFGQICILSKDRHYKYIFLYMFSILLDSKRSAIDKKRLILSLNIYCTVGGWTPQ